MKITATKREDILRRKAEYEEKRAAYDAEIDKISQKYHEDEYNILEPIKQQVENVFSDLDLLKVDVDVRKGWIRYSGDPCVYIRIRSNTGALKWEYEITLDANGDIERNSGSWSGLQATTEDDISSLRQTVEALDRLTQTDWKPIIDVKLPEYSDYKGPNLQPPAKEEDFDEELRILTFEELIGENKIIKVRNWEGSGYYSNVVWVKINGETPSFWKVEVVPNSAVLNDFSGRSFDNFSYDVRVKKSNLVAVEPIEIREI